MRLAYLYPVLLLAAACSDPVEPGARTLEGVYALRDAPVILSGDPETWGDTIRISGDNIAVRVQSWVWHDTAGTSSISFITRYDVSRRWTRIEFDQQCPPNALCTPPPHMWGLPGRGGLLLRHRSNPDIVREYERISDLPGIH